MSLPKYTLAVLVLAVPVLGLGIGGQILGEAASNIGVQQTRASWRFPAGDDARGQALAGTCLSCHGSDAPEMEPVAPKLFHQRDSYIFFALRDYRDGARISDIMEPFAQGLSDQDIRDLAVYLSGDMLGRPPKARVDLAIYARITRECTWCHGETGIGELEGMPVLTGQDAQYIESALAAYRDGSRSNRVMAAVAQGVSQDEAKQLGEYYSAHAWLENGP